MTDKKRKLLMKRNYDQFDTISRLLNGLKRDIDRYIGINGFNTIEECGRRPEDIIKTEMRDKITVPQNFQQIQAVNQPNNQFNQLQTCNNMNMSSQFNSMQSVPYNNPNNYMLTRFMY
jgi:hypothetical protein